MNVEEEPLNPRLEEFVGRIGPLTPKIVALANYPGEIHGEGERGYEAFAKDVEKLTLPLKIMLMMHDRDTMLTKWDPHPGMHMALAYQPKTHKQALRIAISVYSFIQAWQFLDVGVTIFSHSGDGIRFYTEPGDASDDIHWVPIILVSAKVV